jgi:hypothetical protein
MEGLIATAQAASSNPSRARLLSFDRSGRLGGCYVGCRFGTVGARWLATIELTLGATMLLRVSWPALVLWASFGWTVGAAHTSVELNPEMSVSAEVLQVRNRFARSC